MPILNKKRLRQQLVTGHIGVTASTYLEQLEAAQKGVDFLNGEAMQEIGLPELFLKSLPLRQLLQPLP